MYQPLDGRFFHATEDWGMEEIIKVMTDYGKLLTYH